MSKNRSRQERPEPIARDVRSLPSAPSLEYERKEAKALLKLLRTGDADALRRVQSVHAVALRDRRAVELKLSDAQHVIAREYGFTSWPRMVQYFEELERHRNAPRYNSSDNGGFEENARGIMRRHQRGDVYVARQLSHFVPRFFARTHAEILATPITEDDARLVVARERRRASWDELVERASASRARKDSMAWEGPDAPRQRARTVMRDHDVNALAALLDEYPELLTPSVIDREWRVSLERLALDIERETNNAAARRVTDFLASRGVDVQRALDERLLGWPHDEAQPAIVRWYLDRGANPNWMPPNGISVLEHALVRYHSSECVDLIAKRVTPRRSLWIAAGLGDVASVRGFIAGKGRLTAKGRLNRPDLLAMGERDGFPPNNEADDLEIMWEAFRIAGWNSRWNTMDVLLEAGLPVDHAPIPWPLIMEAVGNMIVPLAEYLISRGADLDREWRDSGYGSARSLARSWAENVDNPNTEKCRRILELCGAGTVEEILAKKEAKRPSPPLPEERTLRAMQLAADDAARQGQSAVTTENMLIGFFRVQNGVFASTFMGTSTDMAKLRAMIAARLLPDSEPLLGQELPADPFADAAVRAAREMAGAHRRETVSPFHLLFGILSQADGPGARLLRDAGLTEDQMRERWKSWL